MLESMTAPRGFRFLAPCKVALLCGLLACDKSPTSDGQDPFSGDPGTAVQVQSESELDAATPKLTITMIDVGQGDGMILQMPSGAVVALDGGPDRAGNYQDAIRAYNQVDYIVLSHAHSDHYTGLGNALALLPADCDGRVYDPGYDRPDIPGYEYFRSVADCRYRGVGNGMTLNLDPQVPMEVVGVAENPYPSDDGWGINNTSMVTYLRYGKFAAVFTGDAQTEAEQKVVAAHGVLKANVMKIGHHGSCNATGTTLLKTIKPDVALISAAKDNDFGHPHCQTLKKIAGQGSHWYRTDRNGKVSIISDGQRFVVTMEKGKADDPVCPRDCASPSDF